LLANAAVEVPVHHIDRNTDRIGKSKSIGSAMAFYCHAIEDVDWLVPHQANRRILDSTAKKLKISGDKVIVTVDRHANTSAASIPLALADGVDDGRIKPGQLVLMEAMGGGFTWGSALVRL
jgi:3-oxoacyl-[acyl-carrier-protein] synthase-3